jgi:hypothetical protein
MTIGVLTLRAPFQEADAIGQHDTNAMAEPEHAG